MKKNFMIALVAAVTISFAACNSGTSGAGSADNKDSAKVETPAPAAPVSDSSNGTIDKYADLVEKMIALQEKVQAGDAEAVQELSKLGQELANMATEIQNELPNMSADQVARFNDLAQKMTQSAQPK